MCALFQIEKGYCPECRNHKSAQSLSVQPTAHQSAPPSQGFGTTPTPLGNQPLWVKEENPGVTGADLGAQEPQVGGLSHEEDMVNPIFQAPLSEEEKIRRLKQERDRLKEERHRREEELDNHEKLDRLRAKVRHLQEQPSGMQPGHGIGYWREDGLTVQSPVTPQSLQPPPRTSAGQQALAQRERMKENQEALKTLSDLIKGVARATITSPSDRARLEEKTDVVLNQIANPDQAVPAKVSATPGRSGSSNVFRKTLYKSMRISQTHFWKSGTYRYVSGVASDCMPDLESDAFALSALKRMEDTINTIGVPMYDNHNHSTQIGEWYKAKILDNQLLVEGKITNRAYEPSDTVYLSVGGDASGHYENFGGRSIKRYTDADLWEISLVDQPANPRASGRSCTDGSCRLHA